MIEGVTGGAGLTPPVTPFLMLMCQENREKWNFKAARGVWLAVGSQHDKEEGADSVLVFWQHIALQIRCPRPSLPCQGGEREAWKPLYLL